MKIVPRSPRNYPVVSHLKMLRHSLEPRSLAWQRHPPPPPPRERDVACFVEMSKGYTDDDLYKCETISGLQTTASILFWRLDWSQCGLSFTLEAVNTSGCSLSHKRCKNQSLSAVLVRFGGRCFHHSLAKYHVFVLVLHDR